MKVINTGDVFRFYGDDMQTFDRLPAQTYGVNFSKFGGFYLTKSEDIEVGEKVYGIHDEKVEKVLRSFNLFERNLGVILSGPKGIGKSLFAKMLAVEAVRAGYPVIVANSYIPGIADFLTSIRQEVVVMFDEFDKTFFSKENRDTALDPQTEMLTLFDGMSAGKKLFVITCNELRNISEFLVNRPGRFHYHYRFEYPTSAEIREYLEDKIPATAYGEIQNVVTFARKIDLNYDCLRAIAFELANGLTFEKAIADLNIVNMDRRDRYIMEVRFKDGGKTRNEFMFDMFDDEISVEVSDENNYDFYVKFDPHKAVYSFESDGTIIHGEDVGVDWEDDYYSTNDEEKAKLAERKRRQIDYVFIRRKGTKKLHYAV